MLERTVPAARSEKRAVSCQPPRCALQWSDIECRRGKLGVPVHVLMISARVSTRTYYEGRAGRCTTRVSTLQRLADTLDRLAEARAWHPLPHPLIAGLVGAAESLIIDRACRDRALAAACNPERAPRGGRYAVKLPARRARALALYLVTVELQLDNAEVARAVGCSRQNVHQLRAEMEDLRENPKVDRLLGRVAAMLRLETMRGNHAA